MRRLLFAMLALTYCGWCGSAWAARSQLITETTARQHGLTRPWFSQVAVNNAGGRLAHLVLYEGVLYASTDKAVVHAFDAETGATLWWRQVGSPSHPTMRPGVNHEFLALINGSRLFVLNRRTGELLLEKDLNAPPGAGPAVSARRVYVPMSTGMLMAYSLIKHEKASEESTKSQSDKGTAAKAPVPADETSNPRKLRLKQQLPPPLFCQSNGKALVQPLVTREDDVEEFVAWGTDLGFLNLARVDRAAENHLAMKYRLPTGASIDARASYAPSNPKIVGDSGILIGASRDGFVYAFRDKDGQRQWRFSVGEPVLETPAVINDRVYVTSQLGTIHCLDVKTGEEIWSAREVRRFMAASKSRIYATDRLGRTVVLNAQNGARLDAIPTEQASLKFMNLVNDRIYLADDGGLIQCLREVEQTEPIVYRPQPAPTSADSKENAAERKSAGKSAENSATKPAEPAAEAGDADE